MVTLNKIKNIAMLVASCSLLGACNFLEIVPPEQAELDDATRDAEATSGFMYSCYAGIRSPMGASGVEMSADECAFPPLVDNARRSTSYGLYTAESPQDDRWDDCYNYIAQTHLFLREVEKARGCTPEEIEGWKAEAYFLLAYYHFELLRFHGPIPIIEHYIDPNLPIEDYPARMHYDYVTDWIVNLLEERVLHNEYLVDMRPEDEFGLATRVAGYALKARALLYAASPLWNGSFPYPNWKNSVETPGYGYELVSYQYDPGKWTRAKQACEEAVKKAEEAGYALYSEMDYYAAQLKDGADALPDIPGLEDPDSPEGIEFRKRVFMLRYAVSSHFSEGNREYIFAFCNADDLYLRSTLPYRVQQNNNGTWYSGYSTIAPTFYTFEHFYTENGLLPEEDPAFPDESEWLESAGLKKQKDIIKLNVMREPRFYAWMCFDGGEYGYNFSNGKKFVVDLKDSQKQGYNPELYNRNCCTTGFLAQKFIRPNTYRTKNNKWSDDTANKAYRPLFRMADLYLMAAECCAMTDDTEGAYKYINMVRERAGVTPLSDEFCAKSSMSLMDWIRNERFVELWGEGQRFFDLRRWMIADQYLGEGKIEGLNSIAKMDPTFEEFNQRIVIDQPYRWYKRMYIMPIAYSEITKNPNLVQAPGY